MGKLVKRVKILESKLKVKGRNVILSESDNEDDEEQDVDSLIKLAKAAAIAADTSSVPADATQATGFPPSSSIYTDSFVHGNEVPTGTASDFSADPSNKGKSPMVEEDPPIKERSINLAAAIFVAVSILKTLKTEDLSRKLEVNYVKFQFRGGLLGLKDLSRAETYTFVEYTSSRTDEVG
ncbi:hypothetical protein Tco_1581570, partial [Tanacetum coccineum]